MTRPNLLEALLVSYNWPRVGGAGVGRVLKLAKYLPLHGVRPTVLTVENPSVPVIDHSLSRDIAPDLEVLRVRTLEPPYSVKGAVWRVEARSRGGGGQVRNLAVKLARQLLVPDPQILWWPAAQKALRKRIRQRRPDVVLFSGPPFSQFLLAATAWREGWLDCVPRVGWSIVRPTPCGTRQC